jgi:hypothetical protein
MDRNLIVDGNKTDGGGSDQTPTSPSAATGFQPAALSSGSNADELAAALPNWNLLPAAPFVRRVK